MINKKDLKEGPHVINLDEYSNIEAHWTAIYVKNNQVTHCTKKFSIKDLVILTEKDFN